MDEHAPTPSRGLRGAEVLHDPLARELLSLRLVATLATLEPDCSIHAVPMWFALDREAVVLATGSRSRKVRNLERDPRASLVVHDSRPGFEVCGITMRGRVEIVRGEVAVPLVERVHRRYVHESGNRVAAASELLASDDVALRFLPERGLTWDERGSEAARALADAGAAHALESTSPRFQPM
ncbi:MAG TPA: pyridoxamine 5'-phosphate oxidase family protein [Gaiellaceae bacterium]|nr:pyridoxamine 5'-phosphate oxidase family protein [Gaiellaceae bacterium]